MKKRYKISNEKKKKDLFEKKRNNNTYWHTQYTHTQTHINNIRIHKLICTICEYTNSHTQYTHTHTHNVYFFHALCIEDWSRNLDYILKIINIFKFIIDNLIFKFIANKSINTLHMYLSLPRIYILTDNSFIIRPCTCIVPVMLLKSDSHERSIFFCVPNVGE